MAKHHVVFGLGFGDEGKGGVVDYLAHKHRPHFVVRFNGGAQAAHGVVLPDGREHVFAQFGSGAFAGAATFLSRFMLVNPLAMDREATAIVAAGAPGMGMFIDSRALVTTPYHVHLNHQREMNDRHGSCGMGIGETVSLAQEGLALTVGELARGDADKRLQALWERAGKPYGITTPERLAAAYYTWARYVSVTDADWLKRQVTGGAALLFEGAQGVLIDETLGWAPNHTWSNCTPDNALTLLAEAGVPRSEVEVIGVLRSYATRHGAGPLPTEGANLPERHNGDHPWQGAFRCGHFDARLARYAIGRTRPDSLAVTHLDAIPKGGKWQWCGDYADQIETKPRLEGAKLVMKTTSVGTDGEAWRRLAHAIAGALDGCAPPISIGSFGPTHADKQEFPLCW